MRLLYRLRQFGWELRARPLTQEESAEIRSILNAAEYALFWRYALSDQRHGYNVMCLLRENGHTDTDLLKAALLHDVGKTRANLRVWDRSFVILGQKFLPERAAAWSVNHNGEAEAMDGRYKAFIVKAKHAEWGAEMATGAGCSPRTINLIRRHQDTLSDVASEEDELLRLLQWADDQC
jgi:putative nucleotidyltransferase with HDIG domain